MCIESKLQQTISNLTNEGEEVALFLAHTMQGSTPGAKVCHRLDAAKQLLRYGFTDDQCSNSPFDDSPLSLRERVRVREDEQSSPSCTSMSTSTSRSPQVQGEGEEDNPTHPVSYLDILNYDIARQIRSETEDGYYIVEFLVKVMNGEQMAYTPKRQQIKPADRMAAAKELLRRGFGSFTAGRAHLSESRDDFDTIHSDISQRIREFTQYGGDVVRFLLEVMSGELREEGFTISQRVSAAKELLRRAYDINFDGVTWKSVEEYWSAQRPIGWTDDDERELQEEIAAERSADLDQDPQSPVSLGEMVSVWAAHSEEETDTPFPSRGKVRKGATHNSILTDREEPAPSCQSMSVLVSENPGGACEEPAPAKAGGQSPPSRPSMSDSPVLPNPLAGTLRRPTIRSP